MDCTLPSDRDFAVDLESGGTTNDEVGSTDTVFGAKLAKTFFSKVCSGSVKSENGVNLSSNMSNGTKASHENVKLLDKKVEGEEDTGKEKRKKTSAKKPPKPPRPPRSPSLDDADQKLIKEISELLVMKRARIERMKALKKMKASKASSSNGNLFAMLFTILFCLVIVFQGMCSRRSSAASFEGSPESAQATEGGLISVRYHWNPSTSDPNIPGSVSPNLAESVSGSDPGDKMNRATG
ncbi:uncharacterized protein LOC132275375 [Cornus florida]|uniref:uncharacterized protein LOC132275375 n=1 Tax=Cornus florida TaxID=4283 RepID=UPI00289F1AC6|nr:uncharacterized protein LOC132275375 [Cornus florida]